ncbi:transglutaminase family protein [Candidatus Uhrbacteria bacterium]|nr:transglutaminase family protein [Candidatus Uhrbacteria bacterium]
MKISNPLKGYMVRAMEALRLKSWARFRSYRYRATIALQNHSDTAQSCTVIIPIPQSTNRQALLAELQISCDATIEWQTEFGFRYAIWKAVMPPRQTQECIIECPVRIMPHHGILATFSFDAYQHIPQEIYKRYTQSNEVCDSDDPRIRALADSIAAKATRADEYIRAVYEHCVTSLSYGSPIRGLYTSHDALERDEVDCGGFCTFALALLHARGIPSRLVSGFFGIARHDPMHVWIEILLPDGTWLPADPSTDHLFRIGRDRTKSGRFGHIGSDHLAVSWGCDIPFQVAGGMHRAAFLQYSLIIPEVTPSTINLASTVEVLEHSS